MFCTRKKKINGKFYWRVFTIQSQVSDAIIRAFGDGLIFQKVGF